MRLWPGVQKLVEIHSRIVGGHLQQMRMGWIFCTRPEECPDKIRSDPPFYLSRAILRKCLHLGSRCGGRHLDGQNGDHAT